MATAVTTVSVPQRWSRRFSLASNIEHLLDWAEPIIRKTCREAWQHSPRRGYELADLHQEGRIEVFLGAERIMAAQDPAAMTATLVRRRALKAARSLSDRYSRPQRPKPTDQATDDAADPPEA
ncbi:MAG: hypothetical protein FJX74_00095 [Armatimonadetes bacterium]|nr:hypothetical protein [Armatimonadota bacterium]